MANFKFNLNSVVLINSEFFRRLDLDLTGEAQNPKLTIKVSHNEIEEGEEGKRGIEVLLTIIVVIYDNNNEEQLKVSAEMLGDFNIIGDTTDEAINVFGNINGPAIVFPFVREMIASLSMKAGVPPILLPPMNFVAAFDESQREKKIKPQGKQVVKQKALTEKKPRKK